MRVTLSDRNYFLNVTPFSDGRGLEWLITVIVPESDFMAHLDANARATLLMGILALIFAGSIGVVTARWITHPILRLNVAAQELSQGRWQKIEASDRFHEVGQLAASFNRMGDQLREAFETLDSRVSERTRELAVANEHLNAEIVDHKRDEAALRLAYGRLQTFFDHRVGGIGIVIANAKGEILQANDYYMSILGCNRDELLSGQVDWRRMTPPEWLPADDHSIAQLLEDGVCDTYEKEYVRRDGSRVPVLITNAMMPGESGDILAFVLDISERKRSEKALRESEERVRRKLESVLSPEGDLGVLELSDLIDTLALQKLMDDFYRGGPHSYEHH